LRGGRRFPKTAADKGAIDSLFAPEDRNPEYACMDHVIGGVAKAEIKVIMAPQLA
jgi:hypothetical protein